MHNTLVPSVHWPMLSIGMTQAPKSILWLRFRPRRPGRPAWGLQRLGIGELSQKAQQGSGITPEQSGLRFAPRVA